MRPRRRTRPSRSIRRWCCRSRPRRHSLAASRPPSGRSGLPRRVDGGHRHHAEKRTLRTMAERKMALSDDLISILGKDATSADVLGVINSYALSDTYDDPPLRRYIGSSAKGVDVLFQNDKVLDVQIFVQRSGTHAAFTDELPFGIKSGMTDKDVHILLGEPDIRDAVGSKYAALGETVRLTVVYDSANVVSYLSIGALGNNRR